MSATRKTSLPLPEAILEELKAQMKVVAELHNQDLAAGYDGVFLDDAVETEYPKAAGRIRYAGADGEGAQKSPRLLIIAPHIPGSGNNRQCDR